MPDVALNAATIHYVTAGDGFPLILLHGIGSNSRSWARQVTVLSKDCRVVAWDAPGYGRSSDPPMTVTPSIGFYATCLRQMLDAIGLPEIFLLGHSMGGAVAQEFYRMFPAYVRGLILADTRYSRTRDGLNQRLRAIRTMTPAQLASERAPKLLSRNVSQDVVREVVSIMSEVRPPGYEFAAIALSKSDTSDVVRKLAVPTLLIWGAEDEITPIWAELPAGAEVKIIPNAGHLCYMERPDLFNDAVKEFICRRTQV